MEKKVFIRQVIVSSMLVLIIAVVSFFFFVTYGSYLYSLPSDANTSVKSDTIVRVSHHRDRPSYDTTIYITTDKGEELLLLCDGNLSNFQKETGYDFVQLENLLKGRTVTYSRLDRVPWILKIQVGDNFIDNTNFTIKALDESRTGFVIMLFLVCLFALLLDFFYLRAKYARYKGLERKRRKKERRRAKLAQKNQK